MERIKISIVGEFGVGKSAFIKRLKGDAFSGKYFSTLGVDVLPFPYNGKVIDFWDCSGSQTFIGLGDEYYVASKGGIVFCDFSSKYSLKKIVSWINDLERICGAIPIAICANKFDRQEKEFDEKTLLQFYNKIKINHPNLVGPFTMSVKEGRGLFEPLQSMIHYF